MTVMMVGNPDCILSGSPVGSQEADASRLVMSIACRYDA